MFEPVRASALMSSSMANAYTVAEAAREPIIAERRHGVNPPTVTPNLTLS
jgi:hypothetical protein